MDIPQLFGQIDAEATMRIQLALLLSAMLMPVSLPVARRLGLVDRPGGRKQHKGAVPVVGGLVIFVATAIAFVLFDGIPDLRTATIGVCALLVVLVGQLDDLRDIHWSWRIGAQALAALLMFYGAGVQATNLQDVFGFAGSNIGLLAVPFTVFVLVGVINALNMADGVDGLAGSLALVSLTFFACFALYAGDVESAARLLSLGGALVGFLLWNFRFPWQPRAAAFLGNGGSMLLGLAIAWTAVRLTQNPQHPVSPVLGPWTIALPLIDCVVLMFRRWRQGRSPFSADRTHMHHMLLDAGFGPVATVLVLVGLSIVLGLGAAVAVKMGVYRPLLVLAFLALLVGWYVFSRDYARAVARLEAWRGVFSPVAAGPGPVGSGR
jgi:UDP-GlcNAc:undecaprenyl-phosphate/decaprenyl-phosphate GlcNAc-1-phosphate transferase